MPEKESAPVIRGPFWQLQLRLGLLGPDRLPSMRTALAFSAVAWLPLALLSAAQGTAWSDALGGRAFLLDFGAYARFVIAIVMLIITERIVEQRGRALMQQFVEAGLVPPEGHERLTTALRRADRRSSSVAAEVIIAGIAYAISAVGVFATASELRQSWIGNIVDGNVHLSLAGWWTLLVSTPLFWFLVLRWFWRFVVLTLLLWGFTKLNLRLVATHPDRSGGIGFLALYPPLFGGLVFALSSVTASSALQLILFAGWPMKFVLVPFLAWMMLVIAFFIAPLIVFMPALLRLKRQALLAYDKLACQHNRAFEQKWIKGVEVGTDALGTQDISSLTDLMTSVQSIRAMRLIPAGPDAFVPLIVATALPWLAVVATQVPLVDLLKMIVRALL